jgi:pimeloyl-ACP methyl ester carboxylesterase
MCISPSRHRRARRRDRRNAPAVAEGNSKPPTLGQALYGVYAALGPAIDKLSLRGVEIPVLLSSTPSDEVLSVENNAHRYRKFIPHSQWLEVPAGGHFVYLSECNRFSYLITLFFEYDICGSHRRIDRRAMHELMAREIYFFLASE